MTEDGFKEAVQESIKTNGYDRTMRAFAMALLEIDHKVILLDKNYDSLQQLAISVDRGAYREEVERVANDLIKKVKDGDIIDSDDFIEELEEVTEIIHYSEADQCLHHTTNDNAYYDRMGGEAVEKTTLATFAFRADVEERLKDLGLDPNDPAPYTIECDKCGTIPVDDEDEMFCPKCGDCKVPIRAGFYDEEKTGDNIVCEECARETEKDEGSVGPHEQFTCTRCGEEFYTGQFEDEKKTGWIDEEEESG